MARNGSGVYSLPGTYLAVSGETIEAQQHNDPLEDLEADANNARPIVAGGTGAASAADARTNLDVLSSSAVAALVAALIPSGTVMLFVQTAAPTGWTKSTTHNNKALRIVSGTASSGGTTAFTSVFTSRTILQGNLPSYNLSTGSITATMSSVSLWSRAVASSTGTVATIVDSANQTSGATSSAFVSGTVTIGGSIPSGGSGTAMDFAVQYVDVIMATKD